MIHNELLKAVNGEDLTPQEMTHVMTQMMCGDVSDIEISAFLTALKIKGETVDEITSAALVMRQNAARVDLSNYYTLDTCGTGGDSLNTFNISTAVAFLAAAAGIKVVKHGNRSVSSKCGSADVLEQLGINIALTPEQVKACVINIGMGFFYAPTHHKAMKHVMGVRRTLGYRTLFNILGPLSNPASANAQVLGVYDKRLVCPMAEVLCRLGVDRVLVLHGKDGLDELSTTDITYVAELKDNTVKSYEITPEQYGFTRASINDLKGGTAAQNAQIIEDLFNGSDTSAKRDILLLNAGAALYVGKRAETIKDGINIATDIIESGKAMKLLNDLAAFSSSF